jgi:tRNA A37 threonylcarbamoyladenosine biosynthesis protein TsaE
MMAIQALQDFQPTTSQTNALNSLENFLRDNTAAFILKGYAGSGKTTILKALAQHLDSLGRHLILMAPTGRAAKVIRDKTGHHASTIHRGIYSFNDLKEAAEDNSFKYYFDLRTNEDPVGTTYIIDEASMVSNQYAEGEFFRFGSGHLLSDLIAYTGVQRQNTKAKIIFVGDPCQLPPVGDNRSRALDGDYLKSYFGLDFLEAELTEVKRHEERSGLPEASALIRKAVTSSTFNYFNIKSNGAGIVLLPNEQLLERWALTNGRKILITYKNKTAYDLNVRIRARMYGEVNTAPQNGDIVIIGANNYKHAVLNGEFAVISSSDSFTESRTVYMKNKPSVTLTWRRVGLVVPDINGNDKTVQAQMLENFLYGEDSNLTPDEMQAIYVDFKNRYPELKPGTPEFKEAIRNDEFFNCLKIKFGYAVTCHKAQGGEWDNVFIMWDYSQGYKNEGFFRWAYTAVTRSSSFLYNLNPPCFTPYSDMIFINEAVKEALDLLTGKQHAASEEILFSTDMAKTLDRLGLQNEPLTIQDHCLRVHVAAGRAGIKLTGWQRLNYEIRYRFRKDSEDVVFKTFINGKSEFKKPFTILPPQSVDSGLKLEVSQLLASLPNLMIRRDNTEMFEAPVSETQAIPSDIEFDPSKPFTEALYQDMLGVLTGTGVTIQDIEHIQYKERYRFVKGEEVCILDFNYNGDGFFGKIEPLPKRSNSPALLSDIKRGIQLIKEEAHACQ